MSNLNKFLGIGRLGKDPEFKEINSDFKVANFSLAVSEKYKNKTGEQVENTEWINCQANNKLAEIVEKYVKKGDLLYIEGKLKTRTYEKDGVKQYSTFIQVEGIQMFPKASGSVSTGLQSIGLPPSEQPAPPEENDLPFA